MNSRTDSKDPTWIEYDPLTYLEDDMDEDSFDDIDSPDDESELDFETERRPKDLTARQRIEMAREEKLLQMLVADFEDFDRTDGFSDSYV